MYSLYRAFDELVSDCVREASAKQMGVLNFGFSVLLVFLSSTSSVVSGLENEAIALLQFKRSSVEVDKFGFLNNWTNATRMCSWAGVVCSQPDRRVHGLDLSNMGITGRLNLDSLMALPVLKEISLRGNYFYGQLSSNPLNCSFERVDISSNNISGPISDGFLASCRGLLSLNLSRNLITSSFIAFGPSLQELDLSCNHIVDSIVLLDYSLSSCQSLSYLNLSYNEFNGSLPEVIWQSCTNLVVLDLSNNLITDVSLPSSLANCKQLERLDLSSNNFSGRLPLFWTSFANLKQLSLSDNQFSGEIPSELGQTCHTLIELNLPRNLLVGELPMTFIGCHSLQRLDLGDNRLSGSFIKGVISKIPSLKNLHLPFNNISGPLPLRALANCTSLQVIDLSSNNFSGEIPKGFGFCKSLPLLTEFLLPNNFISGEIPQELGDCINLKLIDFSFNDLTGSIPPGIFSLRKLKDLIVWGNNLNGEIPHNLCNGAANLETLVLSYNNLSGIIPPSITKCTNLTWVSLANNKLTGGIPTDIGKLNNLAILQLGNNMLSGEIPPDVGSCKSLIWLDLRSNMLTGPIPTVIAAQTGLIVPVTFSRKRFAALGICPASGIPFDFRGIRPERLARFPQTRYCPSLGIYLGMDLYPFASNGSMIYVDLSYNSLNWRIPAELGRMSYLEVLNLGHNQLTGHIPDSFRSLRMLGTLDLSNNQLKGSIPHVLRGLALLSDFDVSNNNLTGLIPSPGMWTTFPASKYENNTGLCGFPLPPCESGGGDDGSDVNGKASEGISLSNNDVLLMVVTFVSGFISSISIAFLIQEVMLRRACKSKNERAAPTRLRRS